jgi:hypothetical protein
MYLKSDLDASLHAKEDGGVSGNGDETYTVGAG